MEKLAICWRAAAIRAALVAASIGMLVLAVRAYHSEQLIVLAEGGRKTISDYEELLFSSVRANPWNEAAQLRLFDYDYSRKSYTEALEKLRSTSPGVNHWRGWERLGAAYEKRAYEQNGPDEDVVLAALHYDKVLKVYPTYQSGLERRGLLALKRGEWSAVEEIAGRLEALDANSLNVVYMRAQAAEAVGNQELASQLYTRILASGPETTGALYSREDIARRISPAGDAP